MHIELLLNFVFEASHSLEGYEKPHPHLWRLEIGITGEPVNGRIIDIVTLRSAVQKVIDPLLLTYLNDNSHLAPPEKLFPTCETLSQYFYREITSLIEHAFLSQNPTVRLSSIRIGICEMDGHETGAVRISDLK